MWPLCLNDTQDLWVGCTPGLTIILKIHRKIYAMNYSLGRILSYSKKEQFKVKKDLVKKSVS